MRFVPLLMLSALPLTAQQDADPPEDAAPIAPVEAVPLPTDSDQLIAEDLGPAQPKSVNLTLHGGVDFDVDAGTYVSRGAVEAAADTGMTLRADRGRWNAGTRILLLQGSVKLRTETGVEVFANRGELDDGARTVTLTGVGQVMADLVEFVSGGNLVLMLIFVALLSLILGMGLPTTANYIVVSSLMAAVVVELGAQSGLIVPLIAVHLFVFYFGIMADVTPPVGLASFAAAAVSGGDAIRTGFTAFFYSLRTVALPFVFIFNTNLLLIDVTVTQGIITFVVATIAILVFTAGTMGWFLTKSRIYESVALVLIAFALFRPDYFMNRIQPPFEMVEPANLEQALGNASAGQDLRVVVSGPDFISGEPKDTTLVLSVTEGKDGAALLQEYGLTLIPEGDQVLLEEPMFGTPFSDTMQGYDFYGDQPVTIASVKAPVAQWPQELIFIPAFILLGLVALLQRGRMSREPQAKEGVTA